MSLFDGKTDDYTVKEFVEIDENILSDISEINDFWSGSYKFYMQIKNKPYKTLTQKQKDWLEQIQLKHVECHEKF